MNALTCGSCFARSADHHKCTACGDALTEQRSPQSLPFGTILDGKFMVGKLLGEPGGFGIVYLCWDRHLQRRVVIKELFPDGLVTRGQDGAEISILDARYQSAFDLQRQLFIAEARKLAQFDGVSAIVKVTHYFTQNNTAYFVMPYLPGRSLARHIKEHGSLSPEQTLAIFWPLAIGLGAVHGQGILHRDIKPENVMLDNNDLPVLLDFGNATTTGNGQPIGFHAVSRHFAAPEQYANDHARMGAWTDIYALCGLLYFCLSGVRPADANHRIASPAELKPLKQLAPQTPELLVEVIGQGMALNEGARPKTIDALIKMLAPLRPRAFHWTQALPFDAFGDRMRRIGSKLDNGISQPRQWNPKAGIFQWFWLYAQRLPGPATAVAATVIALGGLGLWWQQFSLLMAIALTGSGLFCAAYGDLLQYKRVASIGSGLQAVTTEEHAHAAQLLGEEGIASRKKMLAGMLVPFTLAIAVEMIELREAGVRTQVANALALGGLRQKLQQFIEEHQAPAITLDELEYTYTPDMEIKKVEMSDGIVHLTLALSPVENYRLHLRPRANSAGVYEYQCVAYEFPQRFLPAICTHLTDRNKSL